MAGWYQARVRAEDERRYRGYPKWRDGIRPEYVLRMKEDIEANKSGFFSGIYPKWRDGIRPEYVLRMKEDIEANKSGFFSGIIF
ncbi:MAG: hypothetical protein JRI51_12415 [Deltaproteobacteria bacterium]|nr:hypothetical protein [Deltaproteobacteria bacterium]